MDDRRRTDLTDLAKVLLLVQAAILATSTAEAALFAIAFSGGLTPIVVLTAASAVALFVTRRQIERSRRARRIAIAIEVLVVVSFGVDGALALVITGAPLPLMALVSGFVLPVALIAVLIRLGHAPALALATEPA
jgi:hypothetical protein